MISADAHRNQDMKHKDVPAGCALGWLVKYVQVYSEAGMQFQVAIPRG